MHTSVSVCYRYCTSDAGNLGGAKDVMMDDIHLGLTLTVLGEPVSPLILPLVGAVGSSSQTETMGCKVATTLLSKVRHDWAEASQPAPQAMLLSQRTSEAWYDFPPSPRTHSRRFKHTTHTAVDATDKDTKTATETVN